jgi:nucleoside-diphosphate-sugar epimerase
MEIWWQMKILICGVAGFIGANFMRYMLFREKNFNFIGVDNLLSVDRYKKIYHHKNHKFYMGDLLNINFLSKIIEIEKPDYIINGIFYKGTECELDETIKIITNINSLNIPIANICPAYDEYGIFKVIENLTLKNINSKYIEIPNCFGTRQDNSFIPNIIRKLLNKEFITCSNISVPWVFAEDLASFVWYLLEKNINGKIVMPKLGEMSEYNIIKMISKIFQTDGKINLIDETSLMYNIDCINKIYWVPDSNNLEESMYKIIEWYNINRWAVT